jgi:flavorubredoxin
MMLNSVNNFSEMLMNSCYYKNLKHWEVKGEEIKYEFPKIITTANSYLVVKTEQIDIVRIEAVKVKFLMKVKG